MNWKSKCLDFELSVHRLKRLIYQHDTIGKPPEMRLERETDSFEIVTNNIENKMQQLTTEKREVQLMFIKHNHF